MKVPNVLGIRSRTGWRTFCMSILWGVGSYVVVYRMMDGDPAINVVGYVGGLLFASYVVLNALRPDATMQDWLMVAGTALLVLYGWLSTWESGSPMPFGLEVTAAVALVLLVAVLARWFFAGMRFSEKVGAAIDQWLQAQNLTRRGIDN